jgi:hypothetical protein
MHSTTNDILIQIFAPLAGIVVGFILGIEYDRWKKRHDRREIEKDTMKSLISELDENEPLLKKPIIGEIDALNPHTLFTGAFKTSISSGNFYLFNTEIQKNLQSLYSKIDELKVQSGLMFTLVTPNLLAKGTQHEQQIKTIIQGVLQNAETNRKNALELLSTVRKNIQEELDKLE